jgi:class 3 adenylate cyclase
VREIDRVLATVLFISGQAQPGEVLVSSTVKDLVSGSGLHFEDCGTPTLKGVPGEWRVYSAR